MFDWQKLFARDTRRRRGPNTDADSRLPRGDRLEDEYESLIVSQCQRYGISPSTITIEVRQIGQGPDGRHVYFGMLRLAKWERDSALRMLLGLPLLESKIRRMWRSLWLCEVSHFGGLWLHASEQLQATDAMRELRRLLLQVAPPRPHGDTEMDETFSHSASGEGRAG